jgi:hypothetical protein
MDAKRSAAVPLSSPAAAQRCAEGAGLDSGAAAAAQSAMRVDRAPPGAQTAIDFHQSRRTRGASASVSNLHQLDGRDLDRLWQYALIPIPFEATGMHLRGRSLNAIRFAAAERQKPRPTPAGKAR